MVKTLNTPENFHSKGNQFEQVVDGFFQEPQTMKMLSVKSGIDRANICWFCRDLRHANRIGVVKVARCRVTKHLANYYTTNPELFPQSNQLELFAE